MQKSGKRLADDAAHTGTYRLPLEFMSRKQSNTAVLQHVASLQWAGEVIFGISRGKPCETGDLLREKMLWGKSKILVAINIPSCWQANCHEETEIDLIAHDPADEVLLGSFLRYCANTQQPLSLKDAVNSQETETTCMHPPGRFLVQRAEWMRKQIPRLGFYLLISNM